MKQLALALMLCAGVSSAQPTVSVVVGVDTFDDRLSPYGQWLIVPGQGRVWQPAIEYVGEAFYPYGSDGQWVYTDAGWVFDSDLPFGWAVFHYGRWLLDPDYGWVWVPGRTWAPAWVTWRMGGEYVGWAPMGPRGALELQRSSWLFVETGQLTVMNVRSRALDEDRFRVAVTRTQPVHGAVPVGPPPSYVAAATRREIRAVPVGQVRSGGRAIPPPPQSGQALPPPPHRGETRGPRAPPPPPSRDQFQAPPPGRQEQRTPPPSRQEFQTPAPPRQEQRGPPPARQEFQTPPPSRQEFQAPPPLRQEQRAPPPAQEFRRPPQGLQPSNPGQPPPPPAKKNSPQGPPGPPRPRGR